MSRSVLHLTQPVDGGVAVVVAGLAADQQSRGWRVLVGAPDHGPMRGWLREAGLEHATWEAGRGPGLRTLGEIRRARALIARFAPDLVHLHASTAGLAGRAALRGRLPTVFQPHAWSFEAVEGAMRRAALAWERRAARWTDVILCVSEAERHQGERAGLRGRLAVVPNGVELDGAPEGREEARAALGIGPGPLAVVIGRLARQKGQDLLLGAWPAVRERVPDAALALVGDGPERGRLQAMGVASATFAGDRQDVARWLAAADVVVAPSRWEGMSLAVLEAMAASRPVVATDVAGMREALGSGTGALVAPGDAGALAEAVAMRLADPPLAEREGREGRRRAEERHDIRRTRAAVVRVYEELLGAQPAAE